MSVTITKGELVHLPSMLELEQVCFVPAWKREHILFELENPDSDAAVALLDGELVGFCLVRRMAEEAELFQIAVAPAQRGKHIGRQLLQQSLIRAAEAGCSRMFLEVRAGNTPAIGLYESCGFQQVGRRRDYYEQPVEDAVLLLRNLTGQENKNDDSACN